MKKVENLNNAETQSLNIPVVSNRWWSNISDDDKIWIMMKYGYDNKFDPNRITIAERNELYKREYNL